MESKEFFVEATLGHDELTGKPTFNGSTRQRIVDYCFMNLNYYQMAAKPRILLEPEEGDDPEDYIDLDLFQRIKDAALLCPVCYDVFKDPVNVRHCLHKFCEKCIVDYNRKFKKECPSCRQLIGSRRYLRSDYKTANIISALITDIEAFNQLELASREQVVKRFDFQGFNQKMHSMQEAQEVVLQQEKLDRIMLRHKRKREYEPMEEVKQTMEEQLASIDNYPNKRRSFKMRGPRPAYEEEQRPVDIEFTLRQENKRRLYLKQVIMPTQVIRTTQEVHILQLKKLVQLKMREENKELDLSDIDMFIYGKLGQPELIKDETAIKELVDQNEWRREKVFFREKGELTLAESLKTMETIWVGFREE